MPQNDFYNVDSGTFTLSGTVVTAILELRSTTKRAWVSAVRIAAGTVAAAAGNDILYTLARAGNTPTGGSAATLNPLDSAAPVALTSGFKSAWTTAPTVGTILAEWQIPQASGQMWSEYPPLGFEWGLASGTASMALFATNSSTASTVVQTQFVISEG
jgi:hypothetical protein